MVLGPVAGVFADRWDKRRTMLWIDSLRALLILSLVPLPLVGVGVLPAAGKLGVIYTVVALATVCAQFFSPSRLALIGQVVEEPLQARASGLSQITITLAMIVGPPLAALLVFGLGVEWALLVNAASFAVSFAAILAVRASSTAAAPPSDRPADFLRELRDGLRFYRANRVLMTLLTVGVIIMLGAGALNALDIFFVTQNLHTSPSLYGVLNAGLGLGALTGAVLASIFGQRIGVARMFWLAAIAVSIAILVYSRLSSFGPAVVLLFLAGMPMAGLNVAVPPLILQVTPPALVGRVSSVLQPAISVATMISVALAGFLDSTVLRGFHAAILGISFGPVDTIFLGAGILGLTGGLYAMLNLRSLPAPRSADEERPSVLPASS
jgi:MFS family permease